MYLIFTEFVLCAVAIWFIITQIIIPGFCGTKSFPIFKKEAMKQELKEKEIEKTIDQVKKGLEDRKINDDTETINPKEGV